jgi:FtsP/CotA-like multicopper oxidase with cupredoxin domain
MSEAVAVRRRRNRFAVLLAALAAVVAAILIGSLTQSQATTGTNPYEVPAVVDTNPDPNIVETTLTSQLADVDIGNGVTAKNAQTYNGVIPGPTFHLKVGDTVIVHYENHLPASTPGFKHESGIHWHGIELSSAMDGTPFTQQQVQPGGSFLYKFEVSRPGIFWYHPHHHSSTNQVFKGLYGMIVVDDPNDATLVGNGTLPPANKTIPLVLSDITVCHAPPNDDPTYPTGAAVPWSGPGGALAAMQGTPRPKQLCDGGAVVPGPTNYPVDEDGNGPIAALGNGDIPNIQTALTFGRVNEGQTVLTNGMNVGGRAGAPGAAIPPYTANPGALAPGAKTFDVQPGQGLRMQVVNSATTRYMNLVLSTQAGAQVDLIRVGGESGLLDNAVKEPATNLTPPFNYRYSPGQILLPPGSRADVVAAIPAGAPANSVLTMWTQDYERTGGQFSNIPTVPVAHFKATGAAVPQYVIDGTVPVNASTTKLRSSIPDPVVDLGPAPVVPLLKPNTFVPVKTGWSTNPVETLDLTQTPNAQLEVNGIFGTHDILGNYENAPHLGSSRFANGNGSDVLQLSTHNDTPARHPFHLHGFSIQPIKIEEDGGGDVYTWPYREFRDNVDVPAKSTLTYRLKLDDRPLADGTTPGGELGRWLFHCHIFFHATDGMLSELVVTNPTGNERPNVNVNTATAQAQNGQNATIAGTFSDPDVGDTVTLASSVGSVTPGGGGTYTWNFPTNAGTNSQIVYITATDNHGLKSQIAFQLNMSAAPVVDTTPPDTTITKKPTKKKRRKSIVRFASSEPNSTFTCILDGGAPFACTSPQNYKNLDRGKHTISVAAKDSAGNTDPSPAISPFFLKRTK